MSKMTPIESTCCFTGHRPSKLPWRSHRTDERCLRLCDWISAEISKAYKEGYRHFLCGMAQGCDTYFCESLLSFRATHPDVTLEAAIPCPEQADRWSNADKAHYLELCEQCDFQTIVQPSYDAQCMLRRDRYMVSRSSRIIAVYNGTRGGTMATLGYAMTSGLTIIKADPAEF